MIDQQLIECYATRQDPEAFREIIDRHGPAVLRACRRLLHDDHEAEDAFQATFLILVRRPPTLRNPELLGRWLVGVARRVAIRARVRGARQSHRERRWAEMHPTVCEEDWPLLEIRRAVREELEQLPSLYAQALALCYLDGLTHEEAARKLDCPVGTVKVRLVRGRRLLRDRLDRRGVALGVAFFLFLLGRETKASAGVVAGTSSDVPSALLGEVTAEAMSLASSGEVDALEILFPRAVALSRGLLGPGLAHFRGVGFLFLLALACLATGGIAIAQQASASRDAAASARLAKVLDVDCR